MFQIYYWPFDLLLFILLEHFELCLRITTLLSVGEYFLIPILSLFLELNSGGRKFCLYIYHIFVDLLCLLAKLATIIIEFLVIWSCILDEKKLLPLTPFR